MPQIMKNAEFSFKIRFSFLKVFFKLETGIQFLIKQDKAVAPKALLSKKITKKNLQNMILKAADKFEN